jgi:hypothetical protein
MSQPFQLAVRTDGINGLRYDGPHGPITTSRTEVPHMDGANDFTIAGTHVGTACLTWPVDPGYPTTASRRQLGTMLKLDGGRAPIFVRCPHDAIIRRSRRIVQVTGPMGERIYRKRKLRTRMYETMDERPLLWTRGIRLNGHVDDAIEPTDILAYLTIIETQFSAALADRFFI